MALTRISPVTYSGDKWEATVQGGIASIVLRGTTGVVQLPDALRPRGAHWIATEKGRLKVTWDGKLEHQDGNALWQTISYPLF